MNLNVHTHKFKLQLKDPFRISRYYRDIQPTLIVSISDRKYTGYGEAVSNRYYGTKIKDIEADIMAVAHIVNTSNGVRPETLWDMLEPHLKHNYFALCALDGAYNDWYGKRHNTPLYRLWGTAAHSLPISNYTIGIDSIEKMIDKVKETPWPLYKIKLGTKQDMEIISALRKVTDAAFQVDANGAWTAKETISNSIAMKKEGVLLIEQPLNASDMAEMSCVKEKSALPVIADESCVREADVEKCASCFHGINIKLMKCGGLTPARRMIKKAKKLGMKVMGGCMTESTIGISALAQLAPELDYIDMDGALLLKNDIARGASLKFGKVLLPTENGTGAELLYEVV